MGPSELRITLKWASAATRARPVVDFVARFALDGLAQPRWLEATGERESPWLRAQDAKTNEFRELQSASIGGTVPRDTELPVRGIGAEPIRDPEAANLPACFVLRKLLASISSSARRCVQLSKCLSRSGYNGWPSVQGDGNLNWKWAPVAGEQRHL